MKNNRPLSHSRQFESQESKKLCFCPSSLALDERLDGQNLLFQHCMIKIYATPCFLAQLWLPKISTKCLIYLRNLTILNGNLILNSNLTVNYFSDWMFIKTCCKRICEIENIFNVFIEKTEGTFRWTRKAREHGRKRAFSKVSQKNERIIIPSISIIILCSPAPPSRQWKAQVQCFYRDMVDAQHLATIFRMFSNQYDPGCLVLCFPIIDFINGPKKLRGTQRFLTN